MTGGLTRRGAAAAAGLALASLAGAAEAKAKRRHRDESKGPPRTFVVCHGAWGAGWCWKKMRPLLHRPPESVLFTPTYTGVGERAHLARPDVTLDTHIQDIVAMLEMEDLDHVTLIAHSYGGMVATGVADRARPRIRRLIYLDAFVPEDGESLYGALGGGAGPPGGDWLVPPQALPPDVSAADVAWAKPRRTPQPRATFTTPLHLSGAKMPPRAYIRCTRKGPGDGLRKYYERARAHGWPTVQIDTSHDPHITAPKLLADTIAALCDKT